MSAHRRGSRLNQRRDEILFLLLNLGLLLAVVLAEEEEEEEMIEQEELNTSPNRSIFRDWDLDGAQGMAIAILPKPFAFLSLACSCAIAHEVVLDHQQERQGSTPLGRLIFSRAIADFLFSLGFFLGTWLVPSDGYYRLPMQWGTQGSCTFQGFILQLGFVESALTNTALSFYYLLIVRYGWTDRDLERWEWWVQGIVAIAALISAIYPIPLDMYNPAMEGCYIGSDPPFCEGDECIRGSDPDVHYLFFGFMPMICLCFSIWIMIRLYCKVREIENKSRKYATSSSHNIPPASHLRFSDEVASIDGMASAASGDFGMASGSDDGLIMPRRSNHGGRGSSSSLAARKSARKAKVDRQKSIAVAKQGIAYVIAFLMTHLFSLIVITAEIRQFAINILVFSVFTPSAGTFNFLVFARTRTPMKTCEGRLLRQVLLCMACFGDTNNNKMGKSTKRSSRYRSVVSNDQRQQQQSSPEPVHVQDDDKQGQESFAGESEQQHLDLSSAIVVRDSEEEMAQEALEDEP